jgi:hypothetical protein
MASDPERQPLPFEPNKRTGKSKSQKESTAEKVSPLPAQSKAGVKSEAGNRQSTGAAENIPKVVSDRMVRRMVVFSGVPTVLAMGIFVVAYWLLSRQILDFPKSLVLVATLVCFGLGAVGLSYGVLSASWEADAEGSLLGWSEFSVNFKRLLEGLRASRKASKSD